MLPLHLIALIIWSADSSLALRSSTLPEDLYAFPKYKIQFLNGHPVLNVTAQRWLSDGLVDEHEFLGVHKSSIINQPNVKGIASGPEDELAPTNNQPPASKQPPTLERVRLGSADYLCLLVPPPAIVNTPEDAHHAPRPIETWELLQPLEGSCLYVSKRFPILFYYLTLIHYCSIDKVPSSIEAKCLMSNYQIKGWFSYAYCHGQHIRQFREKEPHLPIGTLPAITSFQISHLIYSLYRPRKPATRGPKRTIIHSRTRARSCPSRRRCRCSCLGS